MLKSGDVSKILRKTIKIVCLSFVIICTDTMGLTSLFNPAMLGFDRYPPLASQLRRATRLNSSKSAAPVCNYSNCSVWRMQSFGDVVCPIYPPSQQVGRQKSEVCSLFGTWQPEKSTYKRESHPTRRDCDFSLDLWKLAVKLNAKVGGLVRLSKSITCACVTCASNRRCRQKPDFMYG